MQNDEHTCKYNIDKMVTTDLHYNKWGLNATLHNIN